jgi:hypothetical protein
MPPIPNLISILPDSKDLLALEPEELGGVLLEVVPAVVQNGMFNIGSLIAQLYQMVGPSYPPGTQRPVEIA